MEGEWLLEFAEDGVSGGESGEVWVVHSCAGVVQSDFVVDPPACEPQGDIPALGTAGLEEPAEWAVGIVSPDGPVVR